MQKARQKNITVESGRYMHDFIIAISFSNKETKLVDFLPLFHKYVKGDYLKYFAPQNFKKFIIKNGKIYWGRNEDVIFSQDILLNQYGVADKTDEILYII